MPKLTVLAELPPEAAGQLTACGIETVEMLAGIPPAEIHRVLELTAWKKGKLNRAPTLDMVHQWADLAKKWMGPPTVSSGAAEAPASVVPAASAGDQDDIPEAIVIPRTALPVRNGYIPPSQRARLDAGGSSSRPVPAAFPQAAPSLRAPVTARPAAADTIPDALPVAPAPRAATSPVAAAEPEIGSGGGSRFSTFQDYQSGNTRVNPLNRFSIDGPTAPIEPEEAARAAVPEELPRTMRRGVVHPNPVFLVFGAVISLLWRLALVGAAIGVPWLLLTVPRPSDYGLEISIAAAVLLALGVAQLVVLNKIRCRICTCHLFFSRNTVKNRKAHSIPLFGKTASLSLHLLLFQWFRCMYCGTAIKLWSSKNDEAS